MYSEDLVKKFYKKWGLIILVTLCTLCASFFIFFGIYFFIDELKQPVPDYSYFDVPIVGAILFIAITIVLIKLKEKQKKQIQMTLSQYSENELSNLIQELNAPDTIFFKREKLYVTNQTLVVTTKKLDIIPFDQIAHVYGMQKGNIKSLYVNTKDGKQHMVTVLIGTNKKREDTLTEITSRIKQFDLDIPWGFQDGFFKIVDPYEDIEVDTDEPKRNQMFLGIIGALLGASLGGILWITIGMAGLIAGIAGYLMMYLAIRGYKKFAGSLDKKGQIISLLIAFTMIYVANYIQYCLLICDQYYHGIYSTQNIASAMKNFSNTLYFYDGKKSYYVDLIIGYALSIWAGYGLLTRVFKKKPIN